MAQIVVVDVGVAAAGAVGDDDVDAKANAGYQNAAAKAAVDGSYGWDCLTKLANHWRDDQPPCQRPRQFFLLLLLLSSHRLLLLRIPQAHFPFRLCKEIVKNRRRRHSTSSTAVVAEAAAAVV